MRKLSRYPRTKYSTARRPSQPREKIWRFRLVQLGFCIICIILFLRLVQIQVFGHEKYTRLAKQQYVSKHLLKAERGLIFDRNGQSLALNNQSFDIGIDVPMVTDTEETARKIAAVLNKDPKEIFKKIRDQKGFFHLERKIDLEEESRLKLMNVRGVKIIESSERIYPFKEELAQVLGFVDIDGNGLSGIELQFDDFLNGQDGWQLLQKDAKGNVFPLRTPIKKPKSGHDVVLTINQDIQTIVEEELIKTVSKFNASGGSVIVTNPNTGEILSLTSQPGYNANHATQTAPEAWRIRGITDIYEPGSTFKIVTMMAALSGNIKGLDDIIFCENGKFKIFGEIINDPESHSWLSFKNVFKYSSNIGTAKIAQEIGEETLFKAARDFGFGNKSGIDLPGEVSGILRKPTEWSKFSLVAISYGHEVAVTPLQMAMAYGAIANGGHLMRPAIVKEIRTKQNERLYEFTSEKVRRVMTPEIAQTLTSILEEVVEDGTGTQAQIPNGGVAGKTGTAQKPLEGRPGYSDSKFVASFAGFYPAESPEYLIFICIDEPFPIHSGGNVAAPTFKRILQRILEVCKSPQHYDKPTVMNEEERIVLKLIPDLTGRKVESALRVLQDLNIEHRIIGKGGIIVGQRLKTDPHSGELEEVELQLSDYSNESEYVVMPSLLGLSMRKAVSKLAIRGLSAKVFGSGLVQNQVPEAGAKIKVGARCMLEFKRSGRIDFLN